MEVAHDRMRLPSVASEVALAVDAAIQRAGLYQQKIHVLSEMNKTIACSVDKARARARLPAGRRAARGHAPLDRVVPRERPGDLDGSNGWMAASRAGAAPPHDAQGDGPLVLETMRPRQWIKNAFVLGGLVFSGHVSGARTRSTRGAVVVRGVLPGQRRRPTWSTTSADAETDRLNPRTAGAPDRARRPLAAHGSASPRSVAAVVGARPRRARQLGDAGRARRASWLLQLAYSLRAQARAVPRRDGDRGGLRAARAGRASSPSTCGSPSGCCSAPACSRCSSGFGKRRGEAVALGGEAHPQRPVLEELLGRR